MTRNKLYSLLLIACFAGVVYLFYNIHNSQSPTTRVCFFKNVTGYSCPSCGTTRAVGLLLKGELSASITMNPFGILIAIIMFVLPFWVVMDLSLNKNTFFTFYKKTEATIRKPWLATILILLVLLNWIWNIYKHL